jgi:lipoyl(octanoyl) transferase
MKPSPAASPLEIYLLGLVDFEDVQLLQRKLIYELGERRGAGLILCEHPPTISVGRSGSRAHIAADDDELRALGIKVHWVNRGGGCVLHLSGQLAAYFIMPLESTGLTLAGYLERLHSAIVAVLDEFELKGSLRPDQQPGVYLGPARVATLGVAVSRWIAYHGFTINVGPSLDLFDLIRESGPCDGPLRQTSMEARRQRYTSMPRVREAVIRHMEDVFGLERHHVYTRHPLIRRKVLSHAYAPSPG